MPDRPPQATRWHRRIPAMALACMLGSGCGPQPQPAGQANVPGQAAAVSAPPPSSPAAAPQPPDQAQAYYDALVARYGADYAACPAAEHALPGDCAAPDAPAGSARAPAPANVLLMLDASGSMAARLSGQTKMAAAQDALTGFIGKLPATARVGLRVYGHTGNNTDSGKAESCAGSQLLYPLQAANPGAFARAVRSFSPTGWTPIAASLDAAAQDFAAAPDSRGGNVVYVVSDGIETCGGDPVAAARRLHDAAINVVVNVIGFGVDAQAAHQLEAIARAGGGEYLGADSPMELASLLNQRTSQAYNRYHCATSAQHTAYNRTSATQDNRANCLHAKAYDEWNKVSAAANDEYNRTTSRLYGDSSLAPGTRDAQLKQAKARWEYANAQAAAKRDGIANPANAERDTVNAQARARMDSAVEQEQADLEQRIEQAGKARQKND